MPLCTYNSLTRLSLSLRSGLHLVENLEEIGSMFSNPKNFWIHIFEHLRCSGNEPEPRDNLLAVYSSMSPLHTSHFSLLTAFFTLQTSHFTLHTALFTPQTSHCTLHIPHFISSEPFSPYPSSSLLISSLLICHLSFHESLHITSQYYY